MKETYCDGTDWWLIKDVIMLCSSKSMKFQCKVVKWLYESDGLNVALISKTY